MSKEILDAIENSNRAFEEFKKVNDARIEELNKGGATADMQAKMAAIQSDMLAQKRLIEDMEAKAKRPHFGSDGKEVNQAEVEHKQAFNGFMRKGKVDGLADLEAKASADPSVLAGDLGEAEISGLTPEFQQAVSTTLDGTLSQPIRTSMGLHLVMVCGRRSSGAQLPTPEQVESRLMSVQLSNISKRILRDLRTSATIETR